MAVIDWAALLDAAETVTTAPEPASGGLLDRAKAGAQRLLSRASRVPARLAAPTINRMMREPDVAPHVSCLYCAPQLIDATRGRTTTEDGRQ